jgi:hypothetical protein
VDSPAGQQYVQHQRETYRGGALLLYGHQRSAVEPFFPASALDSARVPVLAGEHVSNPPFYSSLQRMGFESGSLPDFSLMAAITFADTVISHGPFTDRLLFTSFNMRSWVCRSSLRSMSGAFLAAVRMRPFRWK